MSSFFKSTVGELGFTFASFCFCSVFFSLVTDDYGSFGYNLASGQFSDYPYFDLYYLGLIGIREFYKVLYNILPAYNWMGISFVLFEFLALYFVLVSIRNVILTNIQNIFIIRIVQILIAAFFIENIIFMSHTRFSLVFCGISLINLAYTKEITKGAIVFNTALFILGMCIRPESSMGMLLLVGVGYLIYSFNLKHLLKRFLLPTISAVVLFTAFAIDWGYTDTYVKKVEPEIEYKMADRRIDISEMKSSKDSIKYEAAKEGMWFDTNEMTPEFLRSLILPGINLSAAHASKIFFHVFSFYQHYLFILFSVASFIFLCFFEFDYRKKVFKIILFQLFTFIVIYALDYNGRLVAERHFLNLELISLLIISLYFFNSLSIDFWTRKKRISIGCLLFVLCGTGLTLKNYKTNNDMAVFETNSYEQTMKKVENLFSNRTIILTVTNYHLFDRSFSLKSKNYSKNQYLMFDMFTYSLTPGYVKYLSSECNCNALDPVAFFNWLSQKNALYISSPERFDLTEKYMRIIHNQHLKFIPQINVNNLSSVDFCKLSGCDIRNIILLN